MRLNFFLKKNKIVIEKIKKFENFKIGARILEIIKKRFTYSTVTDLAKFLGLSISQFFKRAT